VYKEGTLVKEKKGESRERGHHPITTRKGVMFAPCQKRQGRKTENRPESTAAWEGTQPVRCRGKCVEGGKSQERDE